MLVDFHSHSSLSDGTLSIDEMVAAADRRGYDAYAVTDHVTGHDARYSDTVVAVRDAIERLRLHTPVRLFAGVELTDFAPSEIPMAAEMVRRYGAEVVVVHGECVSMTVLPGTNSAAVRSPGVDILAHPGLISEEDAREAARHAIFLELSARQGHNWANGHVHTMARKTGAALIVDSDSHDESGLLSVTKVEAIVRGAGGSLLMLRHMTEHMAPAMVERVRRRSASPRARNYAVPSARSAM